MDYGQVQWLPLCAGLTLVGLLASWFVWRRRGAASGLRGVAWSLLPIAAYLIGVVGLLWKIGVAIAGWALRFVFFPTVWLGVAVVGLAAVLFLVSGVMRRRAPSRRGQGEVKAKTPSGKGELESTTSTNGSGDTDDFADIEEILRRRNIT